MRPLGGIVIKQPSRSQERHDLIERTPECPLNAIVIEVHEHDHNKCGKDNCQTTVYLHLGVIEHPTQITLHEQPIQQYEIDTGQETEQGGCIFHRRGMEVCHTVIMWREPSRGNGGHGVIDGIEPVHAKDMEYKEA